MSNENTSKSIQLFAIALTAPFLVWILLRVVASMNPPSFDPNPWIQNMVEKPGIISTQGAQTRWVPIVGKDGELFIEKDGGLQPLSSFSDDSEKVIFAVHAQGPSLAKKFFEFLTANNLLSRSLTLSSSDGFLKDLRFHDPNLALGCGQAYVVRWRMLKQLGLERMMTISMSGVWLEPATFASSQDSLSKYFSELKVPVFIGPLSTEEAKKQTTQANFLTR